MEIQKLKQVAYEDLPIKHREWSEMITKIFKQGVAEAIAENERLGLVTNESTSYTKEVSDSKRVAEPEDE